MRDIEAFAENRAAELRRALAPRRPKQTITPQQKAAPVSEAWTQADGYAAVDARSGGRCECGRESCQQRAEVHHHIAGRVGPDPHNPSNLLHLTDECHRRIHANPRQSYKDGTMRSRLAVKS